MVALAVLLAVIGAWPAALPVQSTTPATGLTRVFVHTEDTTEGPELSARRQSVTDLSASFAGRKKTFTVVDLEAKADVIVEVLDRGLIVPKVILGVGPRPGDPTSIPGMNGPVRSAVLRVKVTHGDRTVIFTNKNQPGDTPRAWRSAADDIESQIEKWLKGGRSARVTAS